MESNHENHANFGVNMTIDGKGQFDIVNKTWYESNPNMLPEATFRL